MNIIYHHEGLLVRVRFNLLVFLIACYYVLHINATEYYYKRESSIFHTTLVLLIGHKNSIRNAFIITMEGDFKFADAMPRTLMKALLDSHH